MPYPKEFTPEMTEDFYKSLARPIEERTNLNVGRARSEALARGMEGDPFESLGVASARNAGADALGDLWSGISMQGAGMAREERMRNLEREDVQAFGAEQTGLGREWQSGESQKGRVWQSGESQKGRVWQSAENVENKRFQERMAQRAYDDARSMERLQNRRAYQTEIWNTGADLLRGAIGGSF